MVQDRFKQETEALRKSWMHHPGSSLRDYLVQDVEDPRINTQSILTRHFLIQRLFPARFSAVMEQELRFSLVINWLLKLLKASVTADQLRTLLDALLDGKDNADTLQIPQFISDTFESLALPNYICDLLTWTPVETTDVPIPEYLLNTFQSIWRELLENEKSRPVSVLEPACGSANDFRFINAFGIARFIDYTGFDLCEKNIRNAKQMFPNVRFEVGNVFQIDVPDNAFDYCFVHDLFEHLSIEAMEAAIAEVCRVTRHDVCIGFFNMQDGNEHIVKAVDNYHWNTLSLDKTKATFSQHASDIKVIHIDSFLLSRFGCDQTHNKGAYTFIIKM
ncbi:MAG: class I SAM-dependent methyltransferase [Planctomycetota bacterium]|jgi:ubiquinone/menaquinone biosynthesis C-methylase UbiE